MVGCNVRHFRMAGYFPPISLNDAPLANMTATFTNLSRVLNVKKSVS